MIVVDSSALIAILRREPEADDFLRILSRTQTCLLSAVSYLETSMVLAGRTGTARSWSALDALISTAAIEIVPHDTQQAVIARRAFIRYGKGRHPAALNFGDCAAYALANLCALPLLFKGGDFAETDLAPAARHPA